MTRAMFAQVLANLEGIDLAAFANVSPSFEDVSADAWYFAAVQWAAEMGIVRGVGDGNFDPSRPITREQMAVMLHRYITIRDIEIPRDETTEFIDQADISYWAVDAVGAIQAAGIIQGNNGAFSPQNNATRAEVATIFARFLNLIR